MNDMSEPRWNPYAAGCPTRAVLDRIGDKWTVLLLGLLMRGPMRFNALQRAIEGLSHKVLSQTLKAMERDGVVRRESFATVPVTVEYSLTPLGQSLGGVVDGLIAWAEANAAALLEARVRYDAG